MKSKITVTTCFLCGSAVALDYFDSASKWAARLPHVPEQIFVCQPPIRVICAFSGTNPGGYYSASGRIEKIEGVT